MLWKENENSWRGIPPGIYNRGLYQEGFGSVSLVRFKNGSSFPLHRGGVDHLGILIKGSGIFDIDARKVTLREGDAYHIKQEDDHGFTNTSEDESIMMEIFVAPRENSARIRQKPEQAGNRRIRP